MKYRGKAAAILLLITTAMMSAQSPHELQDGAQETQIRGYWVDPSTGLMWAGKDNGKDVSWNKAMKYCRDLRLAGQSDWRLANIDELRGIYDKDANAPGRAGPGAGRPFTFHVKGNLFLTGNQWSSTQVLDNRGHPYGFASRFDFNEGRVFNGDELWFRTNKRALCVRGSGKGGKNRDSNTFRSAQSPVSSAATAQPLPESRIPAAITSGSSRCTCRLGRRLRRCFPSATTSTPATEITGTSGTSTTTATAPAIRACL